MSPRLQFLLSALLAIGFVGYLAWDVWGVPLAVSVPVAALVVGGAAVALWKWSSRPKPLSGMHQKVAEIKSLPLAEAKRRALAALEDPSRFECEREPVSGALPAGLPSLARELFSTYASIQAVAGEARLSRDELGPSQYRRELLRIGTNLDDTELVVQPGEEPVYEIDGSDADAREFEQGGIPTVYHWILVTEEVLYGK
ncbi:MAG TPA: hypothetical protein VGX68_26200 [Thermoanaerobaculia bacterium]|jgi:hypothetical protein|nr:hypothetical protein [Thermoanaerobaculia bacterium]